MADHLHNLVEYPATLGDAPALLIQKLTGQDVELKCLIHAGYHAAGYALGKGYPDGPSVVGWDGDLLTEQDCCDKLKQCQMVGADEAGAFPWVTLAFTILELILKWRKG